MIKYPKFLALILTFAIAYIIFSGKSFLFFREMLLSFGYFGTFLAGIFYAYGFTAGPATAILLIFAKTQNILLAGLTAGLGALIGDLLIFKFIKYSFADEVEKLSKEKTLIYLGDIIRESFKKYLTKILAYLIIASPLPDEIGVSLLAVSTPISTREFSITSYLLNTAGIFVVLIIGALI